jgi:hypothetical protein
MNTMDIRLQQAIAAARAGKRDEARVLLDRFLADEPEDVHGIFLRSTLATSKEEQVGNLRQVLEIDPDHRGAKLMLDRLGEPEEIEPVEIQAEPVALVPDEIEVEPEVFEPDEVKPEPVTYEPVDEIPETMVHPVEDTEVLPIHEVEPVEAPDDEYLFDDIEATAVVLLADEIEEASEAEPEFVFEEETADAAIDETMVAIPDDQDFIEEDFPVLADDEESLSPVEDDEFPPLEEEEEVPEWLTDEAAFKAEAALAEEAAEDEEMPLEMGELPDWLQEEPTEEWLSQEQIEAQEVVETIPDDWMEEPLLLPDDDFVVGPEDYIKPKKKRKKISKRALEVVLGLLIFLALIVMVGLVYVFFTI